MKTFTRRLYTALENQLAALDAGKPSLLEQHCAAIPVCKKVMTKLKRYMAGYAFKGLQEEVDLFKNIKPLFYSKYIGRTSIFNFLMQQPAGAAEIQQAYILTQLLELKTYFDHNRPSTVITAPHDSAR